jgi:hypothetical protein
LPKEATVIRRQSFLQIKLFFFLFVSDGIFSLRALVFGAFLGLVSFLSFFLSVGFGSRADTFRTVLGGRERERDRYFDLSVGVREEIENPTKKVGYFEENRPPRTK